MTNTTKLRHSSFKINSNWRPLDARLWLPVTVTLALLHGGLSQQTSAGRLELAVAGTTACTPPAEEDWAPAVNLAPDGVIEINVGVIIISKHGAPYDVERTGAAIQMGFEHVNNNILNSSYRIVKIERHYGPRCDAAKAPGM